MPETRVTIPIRWRDLDQLEHLNQSVYHEFLEEGRAKHLSDQLGEDAFAFVVARVELDHRHEVRRDHGEVEVVVRTGRIGNSSVTVENEVRLPDGTVAAGGSSVLVAWDMAARTSRPLTEGERARLAGADQDR